MKGFKLDEKGDVVIGYTDIEMVYDNELKRQTVETVLGTKIGEWFLNETEGIDHRAILKKNPNYDYIQTEVQRGLLQVDEDLWLKEYKQNLEGRKLTIEFTAQNQNGETVGTTYTF